MNLSARHEISVHALGFNAVVCACGTDVLQAIFFGPEDPRQNPDDGSDPHQPRLPFRPASAYTTS
jgi:hypothetical protein